MEWYWIALIVSVIAPFAVMGGQIRIAFEEGGLISGLGMWFGVALLTTPVVFLIIWAGQFFL